MNLNKSLFIGKVEESPQIVEDQGVKRAFFTFVVTDRVKGANGQWVDSPTKIPVFADHKAELIEKYVVADHQLLLECEYKNWMEGSTQRHIFRVLNVSFGFKPKADPVAATPHQMGPPAG